MPRLTDAMVSVIKGQLRRGDDQMSIGLWHGINQARVSEVKLDRRKKWRHVECCAVEQLPPPPPYCVVPQIIVDRSEAYAELAGRLRSLADEFGAKAV
jgi:hypothetical protein